MNRQTQRVIIALLLVAAPVGLFFTCFERGTDWEYRGSSALAKGNPYLAWERLLEGMGHQVRILDGPAELEANLPSASGTIFYPANRMTLGKQRSERLMRWVAAGGHLWVVAWTIWDHESQRPDPILDPLGVRQFMIADPNLAIFGVPLEEIDDGVDDELGDELDIELEEEDAREAPDTMASAWPNVGWDTVELDFGRDDRLLTVYFDRNFWLEVVDADPLFALEGQTGAHLVQMEHGSGIVTVTTDDYLVRNDGLGSADHAEVALGVLQRGDTPGVVWLLPVENWPGFWKLLREHAWALLLAGAVWLTVWVWRAGRRFGALIPEDPPVRRSLLEHVEASGHMLRRGRREVLLEATRDAVRDALRARRPGWLALPAAELDERLARSTALHSDQIRDALRGKPRPQGAAAFTRTIATLERIRHSL